MARLRAAYRASACHVDGLDPRRQEMDRDQGDEIGAARHREERRVGSDMVEDEARIFRHQHPADLAGGAADTDHRSDRRAGEYVGWQRVEIGGKGLVRRRRDRSESHTSELQSLMRISYAVFCLKKQFNHTTDVYRCLCTYG